MSFFIWTISGEKVLKFYWFDAYEDRFKQPGICNWCVIFYIARCTVRSSLLKALFSFLQVLCICLAKCGLNLQRHMSGKHYFMFPTLFSGFHGHWLSSIVIMIDGSKKLNCTVSQVLNCRICVFLKGAVINTSYTWFAGPREAGMASYIYLLKLVVYFQLFCGSQEHRETNIYSSKRKGLMLLACPSLHFTRNYSTL